MSAPRFHAGQMVEVIKTAPIFRGFLGMRFVLEGKPAFSSILGEWCWSVPADWMRNLFAEEHCLKPIYDGDQPASWEDCAWRPDLVEVLR